MGYVPPPIPRQLTDPEGFARDLREGKDPDPEFTKWCRQGQFGGMGFGFTDAQVMLGFWVFVALAAIALAIMWIPAILREP